MPAAAATILSYLGPLLLGLLALAVLLSLAVDPAGLYWRRSKQPRNLRLRKLELLRQLGSRRAVAPLGSLVLGSSRVFNLMLSGNPDYPQPVFNFAVTAAKAEDYLACWRIAQQTQPAPPRLLVVCLELAAFHPRLPTEWEALSAPDYRRVLEQIGVLRPSPFWRAGLLFSHVQLRQALTDIQRQLRGREKSAAKFRWNADGSATWHDLLRGQRNPRLLARQLRTYPRNGIALRSFSRLGALRQHCFRTLLAEARAAGTQVLAYLAPEHPQLAERLGERGRRIHAEASAWLASACQEQGACFLDLWSSASLGLNAEDYRDALHLVDSAQAQVEARLAASQRLAATAS